MSAELLHYIDIDGDEIVVVLDPVDDSGEDVLLVVHAKQRSLAARLPVAVLRQLVRNLGPCDSFTPSEGDPGHCAVCGEYDSDHGR